MVYNTTQINNVGAHLYGSTCIGENVHIPDGFLSVPWIVSTYAASLAFAAYAKARVKLTQEKVLAMSVLAAAIFVAQMLNWPIPGGTSLHFVGGALAYMLLGPWLGFFTMSMVITTQAIIFHDGGITTLGANLLNMAIIDGLIGYAVFKSVLKILGNNKRGRMIAAFLGGWAGITIAGIAAGIEIGLSPSFPYGVMITVPIMGTWHAILGVIEGLITALVYEYMYERGWRI